MLKSIMLLLFLGLVACGKGADLPKEFTLTSSSCGAPTTTIQTLYSNPFMEGKESVIAVKQTIGTCSISAEVTMLVEAYSLTTKKIKVYAMTCDNMALDWGEYYTFNYANDVLTIQSNACKNVYSR